MENNEVTLKKIPLKIFIEILQDAWDRGADYIDIIGVPDAIQDNISIAIKEEYMHHEEDGGSEEEDRTEDSKDITDEDLNQLI
jgi:hypothetical protein